MDIHTLSNRLLYGNPTLISNAGSTCLVRIYLKSGDAMAINMMIVDRNYAGALQTLVKCIPGMSVELP